MDVREGVQGLRCLLPFGTGGRTLASDTGTVQVKSSTETFSATWGAMWAFLGNRTGWRLFFCVSAVFVESPT